MNALDSFLRGAGLAATLLFSLTMASAWAAAPTAPPAARSDLAPTGKLRVGVLTLNPVFVTKDGSAGEMRGVAADLARGLAKQLGVPFEPVRYNSVAKLVDGGRAGEWDIAFLGFAEERAALMDFTAPYLEIGSTFLVPQKSQIRALADADKAGIRIGVAERSVQDGYLTKNIKQAQLIRLTGGVASWGLKMLNAGKVDAIVGNRVVLLRLAAKDPGVRTLDEDFAPARHTLAIAKGRPAGTAYAKKYIEYAKASGLVQRAIDDANLRGVKVAPRASGM
jgi:polar amino acid transport system substrate-binding protein